jgi:hypothetical protein
MATTKNKGSRATKKSAYAKLVSRKSSYCHGRATKADVKKLATEYIRDAVKKGNKTEAQAKKVAAKVLASGCKMSSVITGKKRKGKVGKKSAVGKKRAHARRKK